jgi:hypothetical protein
VSVALHALADDRAVEHVEGREQGGRAVALVIMRGCTSPRPGRVYGRTLVAQATSTRRPRA